MAGLAHLFDHRLGRFILVGLCNSALGLLVIFGCKAYLGLGDAAANATGYALLIALSFLLNRQWTFEDGGDPAGSLLRFVLVLAAAYLANLATTLAAIDLLAVDDYLAHVAGIGPYAAVGYLGSRIFVFRSPRSSLRCPRPDGTLR
ncbi:GtrA family protein [Ramlibacter sp. RBP-2]|uniref:GtrA family protein n=1 Tax=Ramlibacter lithotrophicus TaxID=2606681 RepID=A0A7X6DF59_9BURK|nr:GtrA family protein [Ramlibacter lithotrophicus]NKE66050.1 GtrA family protein [Ramlibacter lithotrophicus]